MTLCKSLHGVSRVHLILFMRECSWFTLGKVVEVGVGVGALIGVSVWVSPHKIFFRFSRYRFE